MACFLLLNLMRGIYCLSLLVAQENLKTSTRPNHRLMRKTMNKSIKNKVAGITSAVALAMTASAAYAYVETQNFWGAGSQSGGTVTFSNEGVGANQLKITFDNTSNFSGIITGIVFNITQDVNNASVLSFVDGNGTDLTSLWNIGFNVNNNITPGNSVFEVAFTTNNGIIGGIYNTGVAANTANTYPDIATLVLQISDPNPWSFTDVGNDSILRTQRTGANGNGSDKIDTSSSSSSTSGGTSTSSTSGGTTTSSTSGGTSNGNTVSEPGILALLGIGLLGQGLMFLARRRRLGLK